MKSKYRLYWFFRNLIAFLCQLMFYPIRIIIDFVVMLNTLFTKTDGSQVLNFPWEDNFYDSYFGD